MWNVDGAISRFSRDFQDNAKRATSSLRHQHQYEWQNNSKTHLQFETCTRKYLYST